MHILAFLFLSYWDINKTTRALGFDRITANALAAVGGFLALVVVFLFALMSDKTNQRGGSVITAHACYLIALILARQLHPQAGKWSRWGLWTLVNSFAVGYHPVHNSWVQLNCIDPRERSIAIAYVHSERLYEKSGKLLTFRVECG